MKMYYWIGLMMLMCVTSLSGQEIIEIKSTTKGISAGVHLGFLSYTDDMIHAETEGGFGYGAQIQYGFTHQIAASLAFQHYAVTSQSFNNIDSPYPYTEIDFLGKYIFGSTSQSFRPNVTLGFNYTKSKETFYDQSINFTSYETYSGLSLCAGGGLRYFIRPEISVDFSLLMNWGDFTTTLINGQEIDFVHSFFTWKGLFGFMYHF